MVLKTWPLGLSIQEVRLNTSIFWVQVHGLPLEMLTNQNVERIGNVLGDLKEVDRASIFGIALKRYLRIRVEMDIEKPLPEGFDLNRLGRIAKMILHSCQKIQDMGYGCVLKARIIGATQDNFRQCINQLQRWNQYWPCNQQWLNRHRSIMLSTN